MLEAKSALPDVLLLLLLLLLLLDVLLLLLVVLVAVDESLLDAEVLELTVPTQLALLVQVLVPRQVKRQGWAHKGNSPTHCNARALTV